MYEEFLEGYEDFHMPFFGEKPLQSFSCGIELTTGNLCKVSSV